MWYKHGMHCHFAYDPDIPQWAKRYGVDWFQDTKYAEEPERKPAFDLMPISELASAEHQFRSVDYESLLAADRTGFLNQPAHQDIQYLPNQPAHVHSIVRECKDAWPRFMGKLACDPWGLCSGSAWSDMHDDTKRLELMIHACLSSEANS